MRSKKLRGMIYPAIFPRGGIHGVERVVDAVVLLIGLANDQEPNLIVRVVDKGMTDAGSGGKTYAVARLQFPQVAVNSGFGVAFEHVNKLFFVALRMRIGRSAPRRQALMMDANTPEPKPASQRSTNGKQLIAVGVGRVIRAFHVAPVSNAVRSFHSGSPGFRWVRYSTDWRISVFLAEHDKVKVFRPITSGVLHG